MHGCIARLRDGANLAWSVAALVISLIAIAPVLAIGVLALLCRAPRALRHDCALPILFGFVMPASVLIHDALRHVVAGLAPEFWEAALHSLMLSAAASCLAVAFAVMLGYAAPADVRLVPVLLPAWHRCRRAPEGPWPASAAQLRSKEFVRRRGAS